MLIVIALLVGLLVGFGLSLAFEGWARARRPDGDDGGVSPQEAPRPAPTMLARMMEPGRQLASQVLVAGARIAAGDLRQRMTPMQIEKALEDGADEIDRVGRLIAEQTVHAYCEGMRDLGSALRRHSGLDDQAVDAAMAVALERDWAERDGKRTKPVEV